MPLNQYGPSFCCVFADDVGEDNGVGGFAAEVFEYATDSDLSKVGGFEYEPLAVCGRVLTFDLESDVPSKFGGRFVKGMFALRCGVHFCNFDATPSQAFALPICDGFVSTAPLGV